MDLVTLATSPAAAFLAQFSPSIRPVLAWARDHEALLRKVQPVIAAARDEGVPAIHAVEAAAPQLVKALRDLIGAAGPAAPVHNAVAAPDAEVKHAAMENLLRGMAGLDRMTPAEEAALMEKAAPTPGQDSQSGSG